MEKVINQTKRKREAAKAHTEIGKVQRLMASQSGAFEIPRSGPPHRGPTAGRRATSKDLYVRFGSVGRFVV